MALVGSFEGQFQHADNRVHRRADFMAHGRQEGAFGPVRLIGMFLGGAQLIEQLATLADVDPATDDSLNFADRVAIGKNPMVNRELFSVNMQGAIKDQRVTFRHHPLVIGMVLRCFRLQGHTHLDHAFTDHFFALDPEHLQVTVVAGLQQSLAITHIDRVGRFIDQRTHELELIIEGALG